MQIDFQDILAFASGARAQGFMVQDEKFQQLDSQLVIRSGRTLSLFVLNTQFSIVLPQFGVAISHRFVLMNQGIEQFSFDRGDRFDLVVADKFQLYYQNYLLAERELPESAEVGVNIAGHFAAAFGLSSQAQFLQLPFMLLNSRSWDVHFSNWFSVDIQSLQQIGRMLNEVEECSTIFSVVQCFIMSPLPVQPFQLDFVFAHYFPDALRKYHRAQVEYGAEILAMLEKDKFLKLIEFISQDLRNEIYQTGVMAQFFRAVHLVPLVQETLLNPISIDIEFAVNMINILDIKVVKEAQSRFLPMPDNELDRQINSYIACYNAVYTDSGIDQQILSYFHISDDELRNHCSKVLFSYTINGLYEKCGNDLLNNMLSFADKQTFSWNCNQISCLFYIIQQNQNTENLLQFIRETSLYIQELVVAKSVNLLLDLRLYIYVLFHMIVYDEVVMQNEILETLLKLLYQRQRQLELMLAFKYYYLLPPDVQQTYHFDFIIESNRFPQLLQYNEKLFFEFEPLLSKFQFKPQSISTLYLDSLIVCHNKDYRFKVQIRNLQFSTMNYWYKVLFDVNRLQKLFDLQDPQLMIVPEQPNITPMTVDEVSDQQDDSQSAECCPICFCSSLHFIVFTCSHKVCPSCFSQQVNKACALCRAVNDEFIFNGIVFKKIKRYIEPGPTPISNDFAAPDEMIQMLQEALQAQLLEVDQHQLEQEEGLREEEIN